jgi:hypothetical protein
MLELLSNEQKQEIIDLIEIKYKDGVTRLVNVDISDNEVISGTFEDRVSSLVSKYFFFKINSDRIGYKQVSNVNFSLPELDDSIDFRAIIHQVIRWNGLSIGLEYRPGDIRFKGTGYERKLKCGYGHIRNYVGNDREALDCYLAPSFFDDEATPSNRMFKVSQLSPEDGDFDEEKFMLGFESQEDAEAAYLKEMTPAHFGGIEEVTTTNLIKYQKPVSYSEIEPLQKAIASCAEQITELTEQVKIQGRVLSEEEYDAIASINEDDISAAVEDWKDKTPDAYENVLEA